MSALFPSASPPDYPEIQVDSFTDFVAENRISDDTLLGRDSFLAQGMARLVSVVSSDLRKVLFGRLEMVGDTLRILEAPFTGKEPIEVNGETLNPGQSYGRMAFVKSPQWQDAEAKGLSGLPPDPVSSRVYSNAGFAKVSKARAAAEAALVSKLDALTREEAMGDFRTLTGQIEEGAFPEIDFFAKSLVIDHRSYDLSREGFEIFDAGAVLPGIRNFYAFISKNQLIRRFGGSST